MKWLRRPGLLMPALVGLFNLAIRLPRLAKPNAFVFDEVYYAPDASDLLRWGIEQGVPSHPPLGKWMIAGGIRVFGFTAFGWRIAAVCSGALLCAVLASAAFRLTRRWELGALAGLLVGLDGVMFVTSRVAMLDIFAGLFTVIVVWFAVSAWQCRPNLVRCRWYGLGAAVTLGLGTGVKWEVAYLLPVVVLTWGWIEWRDGRRAGHRAVRRVAALAGVAGGFALVPLVLYVGTYVPTFVTNSQHLSPGNFIANQHDLIDYHAHLKTTNIYARKAMYWPGMNYPADLYRQHCTPLQGLTSVTCPRATVKTEIRIIAVVNPAVWYGSIVAGVGLLVLVVWKRDVRALMLVLFALTQYVPWLFTRPPYSFYEATLVPLMVLWIPAALIVLPVKAQRIIGGLLLATAVGFFVFLYPVFTGIPLTQSQFTQRMLLSSWH